LPSPLDLWATLAVGDEIAKAQKTNPGLRALLVINQLEPRTKLSRLVGDAITELNMPAAETTLHRRVVYRASVLEGRSVTQMGRQGSIAAEEINSLLAEVLTHE
jgi:chromosome partitioning protein